jgi:hypothetical protein
MLLIIGALITAAATVSILCIRASGGVNVDHLGWMSEQWLAEHRASQAH